MRLAVTRPAEDAALTAQKLTALGHRCVVAPLTRLVFFPQPPGVFPDFDPAGILFTSRNAVRAVADWPALRRLHGLPAYAVGDATAEAARRSGFAKVESATGDAAALAGLVAARLKPGALLYPTTGDRRPELEKLLQGKGFAVRAIEVYANRAHDRLPRQLDPAGLDGVLVYSERTARILVCLIERDGLKDSFAKMVFYVLASGIGAVLRDAGMRDIRVAAAPNEAELLDLIGRG
jgi:uroporphyrinogen-III synthase